LPHKPPPLIVPAITPAIGPAITPPPREKVSSGKFSTGEVVLFTQLGKRHCSARKYAAVLLKLEGESVQLSFLRLDSHRSKRFYAKPSPPDILWEKVSSIESLPEQPNWDTQGRCVFEQDPMDNDSKTYQC
jgi:hypothetical protein